MTLPIDQVIIDSTGGVTGSGWARAKYDAEIALIPLAPVPVVGDTSRPFGPRRPATATDVANAVASNVALQTIVAQRANAIAAADFAGVNSRVSRRVHSQECLFMGPSEGWSGPNVAGGVTLASAGLSTPEHPGVWAASTGGSPTAIDQFFVRAGSIPLLAGTDMAFTFRTPSSSMMSNVSILMGALPDGYAGMGALGTISGLTDAIVAYIDQSAQLNFAKVMSGVVTSPSPVTLNPLTDYHLVIRLRTGETIFELFAGSNGTDVPDAGATIFGTRPGFGTPWFGAGVRTGSAPASTELVRLDDCSLAFPQTLLRKI